MNESKLPKYIQPAVEAAAIDFYPVVGEYSLVVERRERLANTLTRHLAPFFAGSGDAAKLAEEIERKHTHCPNGKNVTTAYKAAFAELSGALSMFLSSRDATIAELTRERDAWIDSAKQYANGLEFYRGLVTQIGDPFGVAARTADDGSVTDSVLALKVPELVTSLRTLLQEATDKQVSCFDEGERPSYRQGAPSHELEELVTVKTLVGKDDLIIELRTRAEAAEKRVEELTRDKERLDWLESQEGESLATLHLSQCFRGMGRSWFKKQIRAAIDAARAPRADTEGSV